MSNALNIRIIDDITTIAQGDTASTITIELLDDNYLILPYLNGSEAVINFISSAGEIKYQVNTFVFDSRVEFNMDTVLDPDSYRVEISVYIDQTTYVFPSNTDYRLKVNKSANDFYNVAISVDGVEFVAEEVFRKLEDEYSGLIDHIQRRDNPHVVTKEQVGLESVDNVKQASKVDFDNHNDDTTRHVTSEERTAWNNKVDKESGKGLSTNDFTNSYKTKLEGVEEGAEVNKVTSVNGKSGDAELTKNDIDLNNVDNVKQASYEEFQIVKAKVDDLEEGEDAGAVLTQLNTHKDNKTNPHETTKTQVGLGNVPNYSVSSQQEAEEGTSTNKLMTPLRTKQAIDSLAPDGGVTPVRNNLTAGSIHDSVSEHTIDFYEVGDLVVVSFKIKTSDIIPLGGVIFNTLESGNTVNNFGSTVVIAVSLMEISFFNLNYNAGLFQAFEEIPEGVELIGTAHVLRS